MDEASRRTLEALIFAYAERIDRGDFAGVADLLAHASVALGEGDPVAVGREAVRALYEGSVRLHADGTPRTQHVTTNLVIAGDGDTARARSLFTVFQQLDDLPLQPVAAGRYRDRFERVAGSWRFFERRIFLDHVGDVSRHLRGEAPTD